MFSSPRLSTFQLLQVSILNCNSSCLCSRCLQILQRENCLFNKRNRLKNIYESEAGCWNEIYDTIIQNAQILPQALLKLARMIWSLCKKNVLKDQVFRSARTSCTTFGWSRLSVPSALKIWITYIQAYMPYESWKDSSNQPYGPMGSLGCPLDPLGPPGYPPILLTLTSACRTQHS